MNETGAKHARSERKVRTSPLAWLVRLSGPTKGGIICTALIAGLAVAYGDGTVFQNPPARAQGLGDPCNDDIHGGTCRSGLCLDVSPFGHVCTTACKSDSDCSGPTNY